MQDRWTVLDKLGSGGFGVVYLARHERPPLDYERHVAVKILHPHLTSAELLQRFQDEARLLGRVRHSAIVSSGPPVRLVDPSGTLFGGQPVDAIVMDLADGVPLSTWTDHGLQVPPTIALAIVGRVAEVLHEVYHQTWKGEPLHLVHRDLKPCNLMISRGGDVRVLDLGIARANTTFFAERKRTRGVIGTPGYVPPERRANRDSDNDPAVDVFALGVVLHELLTARMPDDEAVVPTLIPSGDPALMDALKLSQQMRSPAPTDRPPMREVARLASGLQRRVTGVPLADWCEQQVADRAAPAEVIGVTLVESAAAVTARASQAGEASDAQQPTAIPALPTAVTTTEAARPSPRRFGWIALGAAGVLAAFVWAMPRFSPEGPPTQDPVTVEAQDDAAAEPAPPPPVADQAPTRAAPAPTAPGEVRQPTPPPTPKPQALSPAEPVAPVKPAAVEPRPAQPEVRPPAEAPPVAPPAGEVRFSDPSLRGTLRGPGGSVSVPSGEVPPGSYSLELRHGASSAPALDEAGAPLVVRVEAGGRLKLSCSPLTWRCRRS